MYLMSAMRLIRELVLGTPALLFMTGCLGIIVGLLFFHAGSNQKVSKFLDDGFAILFIYLCPQLTRPPFNYLHPISIAEQVGRTPVMLLPYVFYPFVMVILFTRFRRFFKDFVHICVIIIKQNPWFFIYLLLPIFSIAWSTTPDITLDFSIAYFLLTFFTIYISSQHNWLELSNFLRLSHTGIGIMSFIHQRPVKGVHWAGVTLSKNKLGSMLAINTAMWYVNYSQAMGSKNDKTKALVFMLGSFVLMRMGESAGALIVALLLISEVSYLNFVKRLDFKWAFTAISLFLIVGIGIALVIIENIEGIFTSLGKDMTLTGRTFIWPLVIQEIEKQPILGYGFYGFWQLWRGKNSPSHGVVFTPGGGEPFWPPNAHNGFLEIFLAFGCVGFVIFAMALLTNLVHAVRYLINARLEESAMPLIFMTYMLVNNITESTINDISNVWVYYVMLSVRLCLDTHGKITSSSTPKSRQLKASN